MPFAPGALIDPAVEIPMNIVIVESPAKAKTIGKYLGRNYVVKASLGHVKDLPKSKLGVDLEKDFEPVYELIPGKEKVVKDLRSAAKSADRIFLAADPDRLPGRIRQTGGGVCHPVGTCRMGAAGDTDAVVDPEGKVHGIGGLRVVDASIMPNIIAGNPNIPTIMLAEKIAAAMS